MARQARFGGILDHGHEAAVYRNENKPLAIIRHLTFVAEYHPKQYQAYNFGVWDVFSMIQPLSGNVTVCNSIALALFVTKSYTRPWVQKHVSKVPTAFIKFIDYVFDSYV
jgi:hypothetical protein